MGHSTVQLRGGRAHPARRWAAASAIAALPLATAGLAGVAAGLADDVLHGAWTVSDGVALAVVGVGALVSAYLSIATVAALAARGSRAAMAALPHWWRPVVTAALGSAVAVGAVLPAHAVEADVSPGWISQEAQPQDGDTAAGPSGSQTSVVVTTEEEADGGAGIVEVDAERADGETADEAAGEPDPHAAPTSYTVAVGDSLWAISERLLDHPGDAAVAAAWPALYQANRAVIGADPDLLLPGQELTIPEEWSR